MIFDVTADAYGRFMGRYSEPLADQLVAMAGLRATDRVLDVGCGPGALTARLVAVAGIGRVTAIDPSSSFVAAVAARLPGVDVREASAEALPFPDHGFHATLAQLVVHFMSDPVAGLREMARVTRPGGPVVASVWDHGGGRGPSSPFWRGVADVHPGALDESDPPGSREGHLSQLFDDAGLGNLDETVLTVTVPYESFEEWWEPYTFGVGPAGAYVDRLDEADRQRVHDACAAQLPPAPFEVTASAWTVRGRA